MLQGPSLALNTSAPREDLGSQCHPDGPMLQLDPTPSMLQHQVHMSMRPLQWAQEQIPGLHTTAAPIETGATLPYRDFSQSAKPGTQNVLPHPLCCSITSGGQRAQDKHLQPQTSSSLLLQSSAPRSDPLTQAPSSSAQLQSVLHFPKYPRLQVVSAGFGASVSTASDPSANHSAPLRVCHSAPLPALYALEKQHGNHHAMQAISSLTQRQPPAATPSSPSQASQVLVQPAMLSPFASYSLRLQECNAAAAAAATAAIRDSSSPLTDPSIGPSTNGSSEPVNFTAKGCLAQPPLLPSVKTENPSKGLKNYAEADIDNGKYHALQQGRQNSASLSQASAQDPQATCSDSAVSDSVLKAEKSSRSAELMEDMAEDSPSASKNGKEEVLSRPSLDAAAVERRRLRRRVTNRESAKRIRSKREEEMQAMHIQVAQLDGHKTALVAHLTTVEDSCARYIQELKTLKASWCRTCIENVKLYKQIFELQKALNPGTPESMLASLLGLPPEAGQPSAAACEPKSSLLQHDNPSAPAPVAATGEDMNGRDGMYAGSRSGHLT